MLNSRGEMACASAANLFWFSGETLSTPALGCGVLDGIMRARTIRRANDLDIPVAEVRETPDALIDASGVFLTNSLIGLRSVTRIGDRTYAPHPAMAPLSSTIRTAGRR
jgi:branched-chain amino acid aminotransferase/4-amino-4-deoxychorismate lyase